MDDIAEKRSKRERLTYNNDKAEIRYKTVPTVQLLLGYFFRTYIEGL